jgi:hypothetical protein
MMASFREARGWSTRKPTLHRLRSVLVRPPVPGNECSALTALTDTGHRAPTTGLGENRMGRFGSRGVWSRLRRESHGTISY